MHKEKGPMVCRHHEPSLVPFGVFYGKNPLDFSFPLMLLDATMVVVITQILRFLLKPLRQPRVVSEILGGMIMGPSLLSRSKRIRTYLFPDDAVYICENLGVIGFMFFLFVSGVKTDLGVVKKAGRKQWYIALFGVVVPLICTISVAMPLRKSMEKPLAKASSIWGVSSLFSVTSFPVLHPIIKELNLFSSEIGRLALSTAVITDVIGINAIIAFEGAKQGEEKHIAILWFVISLIVVMVSIFGGFRHAMFWIVRTIPRGKPVDQIYVIAILLSFWVVGFVTDTVGLAIGNGSLWLGLAVPVGPPLGAAIVEKTEMIMTNIFMPFTFMLVGLMTDVSSMKGNWSILQPVCLIALTGFVTKLIAIFLASRFFEMPPKESLALGLILSLRGQLELFLYIHYLDLKIITTPSFTLLVLLTTMFTAVCTPMISIMYDPSRPYMVNKRRNIQHHIPNSELRVLVCIHDEESVPGVINLLEVSSPTVSSPISVFALHLVELIARATAVFIDHEIEGQESEQITQSSTHKALKHFQEASCEYINLRIYTSITAKRSMYQDICNLALLNKASLIILPFDKEKELNDNTRAEEGRRRVKSMNIDVLSHAPCSVAVFVDKGLPQSLVNNISMRSSIQHFAVLFLGGADAREALAYADRMAMNPNVSLTVIRFLSLSDEGDNKVEKKLDDGLVTWFWVKNEGNDRVVYREVVVENGNETVGAIRSLCNDEYNLLIVGRKHGTDPVILQGLSNWSENHQLGVIGDYVASPDFGSRASVLVVQQQVLRG